MAYTLKYFDAVKNETTTVGKPVAGLDTAERQVTKRYGSRINPEGLNMVTIVDDEGSIFRVYNID